MVLKSFYVQDDCVRNLFSRGPEGEVRAIRSSRKNSVVVCRVTMNRTRGANCFLTLDKGKMGLRNSLQYFVDFHFKWTPLEAASSKGGLLMLFHFHVYFGCMLGKEVR